MPNRRRAPRLLLWFGLIGAMTGCGTGAGDSTVCGEPPPSCEAALVSAVGSFSADGCVEAIDNYWCGVHAQALAECIHNAQICVKTGITRDELAGILAASVCAAEYIEWDDCFGNGGDVDSGDDDDWDD
jgi:hypothetical protein